MTSAARAAGGVLRLRPIRICPSMSTMEIPKRSPARSASSAVPPTEPIGASTTQQSASRPGRDLAHRQPVDARGIAGRHAMAISGATPPSEARCAMTRRMPSGTTPVPDGASLPMMIRWRARASVARASVWSAVLPLPQWTISSAMLVATSESISRSLMEVVPPLMWPTTWGSASSTTSALMGLEPAMDGPPV